MSRRRKRKKKNQQIDKAEITEILRDFGNMVYVMTSCNEDKLGTITIKEGGISYSRPATVKDNLNFINSAWEIATQKLYDLGIYVDENDEPKEDKQ